MLFFYIKNEHVYSMENGKISIYQNTKKISLKYVSYDSGVIYGFSNRSTYILSKDWEPLQKIDKEGIFALNGYVYYKSSYYLMRWSFETQEVDDYKIELIPNTFIIVDNIPFFVTRFTEIKRCKSSNSVFSCFENNKLYLKWVGGALEVEYDPNVSMVELINDEIIDNSIYFAITKINNNGDCFMNKWDNSCICNFGESEIYRYDLYDKTFYKLTTLPDGSFPINAEAEHVRYYNSGWFYEDDNPVYEYNKIKTGKDFYVTESETYDKSMDETNNLLGYINGFFYGIQMV